MGESMTKDKTVTMPRELVEKCLDGAASMNWSIADDLRAILAAPIVEADGMGGAVCAHEWTDDGEFTLVCTKCGAQEDHDPHWLDMGSAPRDGTMLRLLVEFEEHSTEDADEAPTIGANNFDNDEIDEWKFAGWCWTHDHFTQGVGTPIGWLPLIEASPPASLPASPRS